MKLATAIAAAILAVVGNATGELSPGDVEPPIPTLEARISLELTDADPRNVFETFQSLLASGKAGGTGAPSFEIRLRSSIDRTLTLSVRDVTLRTALQAAAESLRCRLAWRNEAGRWVLDVIPENIEAERFADPSEKSGSLDSPVDLGLKDAEFTTAVMTIVKTAAPRKLVVDRNLAGRTVTLAATGKPVREVLDLLCAQAACSWSVDSTGTLRFTPR